MPFANERASYAPLRRILQSQKVRLLEARFKRLDTRLVSAEVTDAIGACSDQERDVTPELILAVDGGYVSAKVETGYPGAEIGYITIAAVLILVDKLRELAKSDIIDPVEHRTTQRRSSIDTALPGRGVVIEGEETAEASMRRALFEEMANYRVFEDSETMLDTYEKLMGTADQDEYIRCPCGRDVRYRRQKGSYACAGSECEGTLYSTDAMRLHELFSPHDSCDKLYGHVMTTLERLWLVHALRAFEKRGREWLRAMGRMAFFLDGPLAVYGTPAWLSGPIQAELERMNEVQRELTNRDLMVVGIEKSGAFARHFEMLDERGGVRSVSHRVIVCC